MILFFGLLGAKINYLRQKQVFLPISIHLFLKFKISQLIDYQQIMLFMAKKVIYPLFYDKKEWLKIFVIVQ